MSFKIGHFQSQTDFKIMWEKVAEDHPQRCQGVQKGDQCRNKAMEGSTFCIAHGGSGGVKATKAKEMRNYKLAKFKSRAEELGNSSEITSLKDEIALLRMLIEERINQCNDTQDLLLVSGPLSDLILKVERVVTSCHRLDSKLGNLLSKNQILQFAQVIVEIISEYVEEEQLEIISNKILNSLEKDL